MILFASVIVLAVALGYLLGGRLRRFEEVYPRWWLLAILGLALQFVPLPDGRGGTDLLVRDLMLGASYAMLIAFAALNVRLPGVPLLMLGLALNATVITANGGMPVSREALVRSGQADVLQELIDEGAAKHHLLTDDDVLTPLSDVIPIGDPIDQVASIGDVFVYAGLVWLTVAVMRGRTGETSPQVRGRYRGKHRRSSAEEPADRTAPAPPPAATTWGT